MKKLQLLQIILLVITLLISCNNNNNNNKDQKDVKNNLIAKNVIAKYEFNIYPDIKDWVKTLNKKIIFTEINKSLSQDIKTYDDNDSLMSVKLIEQNLGIFPDTQFIEQENGELKTKIIKNKLDTNAIKTIYFCENWFYNSDNNIFKKDINWYSPVRYYHKYDTLKFVKRWIFRIKNNDFNKKTSKQIAKNIIYEVDFDNDTSTTIIDGLDKKQFVDILIDNALSNKIKCFDSMLDKQLTTDEIKKELGYKIDTVFVEDPETSELKSHITITGIDRTEIKGLMFIENWYIDTVSFCMQKQILGMAPVRFKEKYYEDEDKPEILKTIPFVIYFTNEKPKIF